MANEEWSDADLMSEYSLNGMVTMGGQRPLTHLVKHPVVKV